MSSTISIFAAGVVVAAFLYALTVGNLGYDGFSFMGRPDACRQAPVAIRVRGAE